MGTEPIRKILLKMGIPMIISMIMQALYNIVDSAFISNMAANGEDALNALTLAFPVQMLMVAISIGTGGGIMAIGMVILQFFGSPIASVFGLSGDTSALCLSAMRIISLSFVFAGANVAFQGVFQALGQGGYSLIISVFRQFLFIVPPAYLLSLIALKDISKTWAVWFSFPFAEIITAAVGMLLLKKALNNIQTGKLIRS